MRIGSPRTKLVTVAAGLALVAAAVPGLRLQGEPKILERSGGVTVERVDGALVPQGGHYDAGDGDLLLDNGNLRLVVGASPNPSRAADYGAILDVTGPSWSDEALGAVHHVLTVGGRRAGLATERVEAVPGGKTPRLRIVERDAANALVLTTELVVAPKSATVDVVTRIANRGPRAQSIQIADVVDWSGVPTFVPEHGDVEQGGRKTVSFIARRGALSYGLVFPDAPADVEFRANQSETDQTCWSPRFEVESGAGATYRRVLVATRRGISEVARIAAGLTRAPIATITGALAPAPAWALLTAVASDGTVAMKESARDDGTFELAVPPGRYRVQLQSPGGWDETSVDVPTGGSRGVAALVAPQAERLDFRITDPDGAPIPARIVVHGVDGTQDPRFASVPKVSAGGNEVHTVSGEGRVDIPPGRYKVIVSRGIEWSVVQKTIDVKPEQGIALRVSLSHDLATPGWISADLHLHAKPSGDSELPLDDRIASLVSAGVEFAVATDHNHVTDYEPVIEEQHAHPHLKSASGVEVTTRTWGHFNAYPLPKGSAPPPHAGVEPPEIFAAIRRLSPEAVIQVNHPWRPGYGYFHRAALNERTGAVWRKHFSFDFDLIEVVNGYELGDPEMLDKNLRRYFDILNLGRRYTAVGSSDSHKLTNEWAGYPRTYVRVSDDRLDRVSASEIAASLRAGHAFVSLGPFVDVHAGAAGPGDTLSTAPGIVPIDVSVRAADWVSVERVDVIVGGETVDSYDIARPERAYGLAWSRTIDIDAKRDCWVSVVVRGENPLDEVLPGKHVTPFAFTNPLYIDVGEPPPPPPRRPPRRAAATAPVEHDPVPGAEEDAAAAPAEAGPEDAAESPADALGDHD